MAVFIPIVIPNAGAAIAAQAAGRQRTANCTAWIPGYQHDGASVDQMRHYAGCINWLHPAPSDDTASLWLKTAIIAAFIGIGIGIWWMKDDRLFDTWYGRSIDGSFAGAFCGSAAVATCAAVYYSAKYLVA